MTNRTTRVAVGLLAAGLSLPLLTACGGDSEYCATVKEHRAVLEDFGQKKTDSAYRGYVKVLRSVAKVAPQDSRASWTKLAQVTQGVLTAHREAGIALEDMSTPDKLAAVDATQRAAIQKSYDRFNGTSKQRKAIVADVESSCGVDLA